MKKIFKLFATAILCVGCTLCFAGCGSEDTNITDIKIAFKEGTFKTEYNLGDVVNNEDAILQVTMETSSISTTIDYTNFTIGEIDTTSAGTQNVAVTVAGFTKYFAITVTDVLAEGAFIDGIENPSFYANYLTNRGTRDDKGVEFKTTNNAYVVGDDNALKFFPEFSLTDTEGEDAGLLSYYNANVTIELKEGTTYTTLDSTALSTYFDSVDNYRGCFDFKPAAIGKTFKLTVGAKTDDLQMGRTYPQTSCSIEVKVVDGYNVNKAIDLAVLDNSVGNIDDGDDSRVDYVWDVFKENNNIYSEAINAVIIHDNLTIDRTCLPSQMFELVDGSNGKEYILKDRCDIYTRHIATGETFNVYGNYFTLNYSSMPYMVSSAEEEYMTAPHSRTMAFWGDGNAVVSDLFLIGNAERAEDNLVLSTGGILGFSFACENSTLDNVIANSFHTFITAENAITATTTLNINNSKISDIFSMMVYLWGAGITNINNTDMNGCGGPVIMLVGLDPDGHYILKTNELNIDEASNIQTSISGTEGWFVLNEATSTAAQLLNLGKTFLAYSAKSYIKQIGTTASGDPIFATNLISIICTVDFLDNNYLAQGTVNQKVSEEETYTASTTTLVADATINAILLQYIDNNAPVFVSNDGYCIFNGTALCKLAADGSLVVMTAEEVQAVTKDAEYISLYYKVNTNNIMCATFTIPSTITA